MRLALMIEPHLGMTYEQQLAVARHAERLGYEAFFRSDHYATGGGEPVASTDAWAVLAGLARETERIRLGTMVSPVTFRHAGNLAKTVATVAEMAGTRGGASRVELGMGAGWMEREHRWYGFPFDDAPVRLGRLEDHLRAVRGLWGLDGEPFSLDGEFVRIDGAQPRPLPDPRPRLIVGGSGSKVTPRLAATYADEWNTILATADDCAARRARLDEACEQAGRDPSEVEFSLATPVCVGATAGDVERRAERLAAALGSYGPAREVLERVRASGIAGTPEEAADTLGRLAGAGVARVVLQDFLPEDPDHVEVVAREVVPRL